MNSPSPILTVEEYAEFPAVPADQRLFYGSDEQQFGDLYLPAGDGPHPLVVLLHGGCWRARYGLAQLGQLCRALTTEGAAVWNLEYRRLGSGGGWPETFVDVARGVDYVREIAAEYALDLTRVVAAGHSAGGHLALWLAARPKLADGSPLFVGDPLSLTGVVSLAGIPDMVEAVSQTICRGAPQELLDSLPEEEPLRYVQGSPHALLPLGVPQILINGERDGIVPAAYVAQYAAAAQAAGDAVWFEVLPDAGHFELVTPDAAAWPTVRTAILSLFDPSEA